MIQYMLVVVLYQPMFITSIEFNSAAACYEQKEKIEKMIEQQSRRGVLQCVKK
jgi:hypothetical protein